MASGTPRSPSIPLDSPEDDGRAGEATTLDGIYTGAQARRGLGVYRQICSDCHDPADWQDEAFLARWNGESVYRFWYYIYEQMPEGEPPYTLSREQVTDVVTYILQLNALPEGPSELGPDEDSIDDHWLYWGPAP
ncbi:MAG: cytochrome c [Gemmatimonadota bacterium]|nr:cytochrome c [Gemmatimonadota bacterium]